MTESLTGIIVELERQKLAIERALAALRSLGGTPASPPEGPPAAVPEAPTEKRKRFSAAARRRMALGQKARWAKIKGHTEAPALATPEPTKRRISPEGMKRIIAATKKRWRLKRAAEAAALAEKTAAKDTKKAVVRKMAVKKSEPVSTPAARQLAGSRRFGEVGDLAFRLQKD